MLSFPLTYKWDQPGASARVVFHKIGLMGNIKKESVRSLKSMIDKMIANKSEFKEKLRQMRKRIESLQVSEINVIEEFIESYMNN